MPLSKCFIIQGFFLNNPSVLWALYSKDPMLASALCSQDPWSHVFMFLVTYNFQSPMFPELVFTRFLCSQVSMFPAKGPLLPELYFPIILSRDIRFSGTKVFSLEFWGEQPYVHGVLHSQGSILPVPCHQGSYHQKVILSRNPISPGSVSSEPYVPYVCQCTIFWRILIPTVIYHLRHTICL